ncbi:prepilin peptidase [Candidatus Kaiserbacteria bacterium]|nr:MAG: prepilin peptidase [Candidatus Kaiserbacteria bacterium]
MALYWYVFFFGFGAIIGSFLNVVIYRLHTGRSLNGRSHCMSCGKMLSWYELLPVFSYLSLRGACKGCNAYIPSRYLMVEILTGILFLLVWHTYAFDVVLLALNLVLVSACVVMLVYDMRHMIIPNELTLLVAGIAAIFLGYGVSQEEDALFIFGHVVASLSVAFFFWALWFVSKGRWIGFGDVKLSLPFGFLVGLEGVFSMVVFSFWIGAVVSLSLLGLERLTKRGKIRLHFLSSSLTIKSEVPFAPFFIAGFLLVHLFHADIFTLTHTIFFE